MTKTYTNFSLPGQISQEPRASEIGGLKECVIYARSLASVRQTKKGERKNKTSILSPKKLAL